MSSRRQRFLDVAEAGLPTLEIRRSRLYDDFSFCSRNDLMSICFSLTISRILLDCSVPLFHFQSKVKLQSVIVPARPSAISYRGDLRFEAIVLDERSEERRVGKE